MKTPPRCRLTLPVNGHQANRACCEPTQQPEIGKDPVDRQVEVTGLWAKIHSRVRIGHDSPGIRVVLSYQMLDPLACEITL